MFGLLARFSLRHSRGAIKTIHRCRRVPLISIVIPCYNYGRFLQSCVRSLTENQPGVRLDVVIVDDASTDDSLDVALALQSRDHRVRVLSHSSNRGHIATYNDGLDAALGEFVLLLSADDLLTPGALRRAAALLMAEKSVGLVYGNAIHFSGTPPPSRSNGRTWVVWSGADWLRARCRSGYNVVASPEVMMRTSVLRSFGGYRPDLPHAGDFEMWLRTAAVSDIGFLPDVDQAYYRQHGANMNGRDFGSGTALGQLIDLQQRLGAFEAVLTGVGRGLPQASRMLEDAHRTIASQAVHAMNYAYARGKRGFPFAEFEAFATRTWPEVLETRVGRALARRKRLGMVNLPLHPLWAPNALALRVAELFRRWRRYRNGF